jgi:hypothetical protein
MMRPLFQNSSDRFVLNDMQIRLRLRRIHTHYRHGVRTVRGAGDESASTDARKSRRFVQTH